MIKQNKFKQGEKAMIRSNSKTAMPDKILRQVQQVRRSSQSRDRKYAWLIGASVLAITMIVAMLVEAQLNLFSHTLRFALTAVSLVATGICGWAFWQRGKRQNERLVTAAKEVDSAFPALEQRVSTLTSCEEDRLKSKLTAHPAMLERLVAETSSIHQTVKPKPVVSQKVLKLPLKCLAAAGLVMLGLLVWDAPKTMVQLGRFWAPWANLSVTNVSSVEQNNVVARHEPIKLTAALGGRQVEELQFVSRSVEDAELSETRVWPSSKDPSVAMFRRSKASESFDYRFRAGDGQTKWHRVTVADRPKIEDLKVRIVPPAYTGKPTKTLRKLPKKLRVVAGSRLEVEVKPKTDVRTARLTMGKTDWLPMELAEAGVYQGSMELHQPVNFEVQLTELHGLVNRRPPHCRLQVVADQAPRVKIVRPTKTAVLLPDETIDIHFKASDDHGIQEMALRVYTQREGEEVPTVHEVPIPLENEKNRRKIKGSVALDLAQFDLQDGDTIRYEVRASDNFMPMETLFDETETQPMEGVELVQNAETPKPADNQKQSAEANNSSDVKQNETVLAEAADPNAQVAQANREENSDDQTAQNAANSQMNNAQAQNTQGDASQAQNSQSPGSQPQPSNGNSSEQNQIAKNSSNEGNADDDSDRNENPAEARDGMGDRKEVAGKGQQPPADRMANGASEQSSSANENKIGTPGEESDVDAKAPDAAAVAKSDAPTKEGTPADSDPSAKSSDPSNQASQSSQANSNQGKAGQPNSGQPNSSQAKAGQPNSGQPNSSQPNSSAQANNKSSNSSNGQSSSSDSPKPDSPKMAANDKPDAEKPNEEKSETPEDEATTPPKSDPVQMATRKLDVGGQSASSGQQQIKVDQYAGGFNSEHRNKLEIAIAPVLELLKASLENAGKDVRRVMNPTTADPVTGALAVSVLQDAGVELKNGSEAVIGLNSKTRNTPYAFVGLRLESIRTADVAPAWEDVRNAIDADGEARMNHSSTAWNHINRALAMLESLEKKYEQVKRDLKRADDIQKFKKMHQIFVEKSMAMLNPKDPSAGNGQDRKAVEFDLDEEYLKRLKEVLKMRQEMMAELARILADDPQLLRRYMNSMNARTGSIRDQLTFIAGDQKALTYRINAWVEATKNPSQLAEHVVDEMEVHLAEIQELANRLANVQDEFVSWLPLADDVKKGDAAETMESFKAAGIELTGIVADVDAILASGGLNPDYARQVGPLLDKATDADKRMAEISRSLQRMADDQTDYELANNATRRLPNLQKVRQLTQQWAGKLELLIDDQIGEIYSVDQESRRAQLLEYSVKIASLDSQLVAAMQTEDGELPEGVAEKSAELQRLLDVEIPANQLIAAQTLSDGDATLAKSQQNGLVVDFEHAEQLFDEILQAIADELDKLPVQDPIASLLEDPTLDEILFQLENELDDIEKLGLSLRPSNLMFMGNGRGSMSSLMRQLMGQRQRMRNLSNQAYRNALARARVKDKNKRKPKLAKDDRRWNLLVSELDEDMLQGDKKVPPERYRSAIDQYFEKISKLKNEPRFGVAERTVDRGRWRRRNCSREFSGEISCVCSREGGDGVWLWTSVRSLPSIFNAAAKVATPDSTSLLAVATSTNPVSSARRLSSRPDLFRTSSCHGNPSVS